MLIFHGANSLYTKTQRRQWSHCLSRLESDVGCHGVFLVLFFFGLVQVLMFVCLVFFSSPGYVNARLEKETPIFNKQRIDFAPPEKINSLVVSSNQLCMSLGKDTLLR